MTQLTSTHLGEALGTDFFSVREQFTGEQWSHFITVRKFVDEEVPVIGGYWERAEIPWPLVRRLPELGIVGEDQAESRVPELVPVRHGRMLVSPFAYFRGAALPMAADLAGTRSSGLRAQLCGDAHLSNFGAFADSAGLPAPAARAVHLDPRGPQGRRRRQRRH